MVDINTEFIEHEDIWQNPQGKEETDKANSGTGLRSAPIGWKVIPAGAGHNH